MIVAIAALFVGLGGTAIAASHYLITSTSQIKPSVRKALARDARAIVTAAHILGPVESQTAAEPAPTSAATTVAAVAVPVSGGVWRQRPGEANLIGGTASVTVPPISLGCTQGTEGQAGRLHMILSLDGKGLFRGVAAASPAGVTTETVKLLYSSLSLQRLREEGPASLDLLPAEPAAAIHRLTLAASDTCGWSGGVAASHFTINLVSIDVIGVR
jgi:hypothetical protein